MCLLLLHSYVYCYFFFFFTDTPTTEIYTLSLHDALPICILIKSLPNVRTTQTNPSGSPVHKPLPSSLRADKAPSRTDRKSTRLNSSHMSISYAVFCLKKKT